MFHVARLASLPPLIQPTPSNVGAPHSPRTSSRRRTGGASSDDDPCAAHAHIGAALCT